jgi:hypothetical protein
VTPSIFTGAEPGVCAGPRYKRVVCRLDRAALTQGSSLASQIESALVEAEAERSKRPVSPETAMPKTWETAEAYELAETRCRCSTVRKTFVGVLCHRVKKSSSINGAKVKLCGAFYEQLLTHDLC